MSLSDSNSISTESSIVVYTPNEILKKGLILAGYKMKSVSKVKKATNLERFQSHYGANPEVLAHIWEDIQRETDPDLFIPRNSLNLDYFFMAIHFLKRYPEEREREAQYGWHRDTCQDWSWYYIKRIKALKKHKKIWPECSDNDVWILTVDGTHCWIHEPQHPEFSQDLTWFSHKYNKAGVNFELGVSLTGGLVWLNGPQKAGTGDREIF